MGADGGAFTFDFMAGFISRRTAEALRNMPTFSAGEGLELIRVGNHHVFKVRPPTWDPTEGNAGSATSTPGYGGGGGPGRPGGGVIIGEDTPWFSPPSFPPRSSGGGMGPGWILVDY